MTTLSSRSARSLPGIPMCPLTRCNSAERFSWTIISLTVWRTLEARFCPGLALLQNIRAIALVESGVDDETVLPPVSVHSGLDDGHLRVEGRTYGDHLASWIPERWLALRPRHRR